MNRFLAVAVAAAFLQACAGQNVTPSTPYQPLSNGGAQLAPAAAPAFGSEASAPATFRPTAKGGANFPGFADGLAYAEYTYRSSSAGTTVVSGPLADAPLSCDTKSGNGSSSLTKLVSPYVTTTGAVNSAFTASSDSGQGKMTATSTLKNVSILKGVITAKSIKAVANSTASNSAGTSDSTGSAFVGLTIGGKAIKSMPKANSIVTLNGYGYAVLNGIQGPVDYGSGTTGPMQTSVSVNMIRVVVNVAGNALKIPVGTTIVIGSAYAAFTVPPAPYVASPSAYSFYATGYNNRTDSVMGPLAGASVACNTQSDTKSVPGVRTPVGLLGAMDNTSLVSATKTATSASAQSDTVGASLLGGLIVGKSIDVNSTVQRSGTTFTNSGSLTFKSLTVNGTAISSSVAPNTKVTISGLGYVVVNEQNIVTSKTGISEEINAVHLYVTTAKNSYKMTNGAQIVLGHVQSSIAHQQIGKS